MAEAVKSSPASGELLVEYIKYLTLNGKMEEGMKLVNDFEKAYPNNLPIMNVKASFTSIPG
jgi:hypothetical protein